MAATTALSVGGSYMQSQGEKAQADAQYRYQLQQAKTQRDYDKALFSANKDIISENLVRTLSQIEIQALQEQGLIARNLQVQQHEYQKAAAITTTSAGESGVAVATSLYDQYIRDSALAEMLAQEDMKQIRFNAAAVAEEKRLQAEAQIFQFLPRPIQDPLKPDTSWGLGDFLGLANSGLSGALSGAQINKALGN